MSQKNDGNKHVRQILCHPKANGELFYKAGSRGKVIFKLISSDHPTNHVGPNEISLTKRSDTQASQYSKRATAESDDLIILKESMDPNQKSSSFGFVTGTNSTVPYKCGHDHLNFNTDPRGVGNDFLHKITLKDENKLINPLTAQYYLAKRSNSEDPTNEYGCPAKRKVLYIELQLIQHTWPNSMEIVNQLYQTF